MFSAFGVEHEFAKGLLPMRAAKGVKVMEHGKPTPDAHPWKSAGQDLRFATIGPKKPKIAKGLKPNHIAALERVAGRKWSATGNDTEKIDYARARLHGHDIKDMAKPEVVQRMTISRGMYKDNAKRAVENSASFQRTKRGGKTGIRVMEGPKIKYGRRKGHLRLIEGTT